MSEGIVPVEPTMEPAAMRAIAAEYPRTLARLNHVAHTPAWAWTTLGLWIPDDDPQIAADQARALLETATPDEPAHAEVLWRAPDHDRPAWWRAAILASGHGAGIAWLQGEFADPTTRMIDLHVNRADCTRPPSLHETNPAESFAQRWCNDQRGPKACRQDRCRGGRHPRDFRTGRL
jgi:hypothetical protein